MADTELLSGRIFDEKYRIEEQLGAGGMGAVYRATHLRLEQSVAIKVINPHLLASREARARFRREAQTAVKVQHPNAVNVNDYGETADGYVYLVMDFLEGASLRQIINAEAPLDPARAVSLMAQVSAAVGAAHDVNILHRDLKPSNIFIEQRKDAPPTVRLLDFGVAKLLEEEHSDESSAQHYRTEGGAVVGTPRYMSPEQSEGETLTPASDVYSLGVIMYEMLTGETPFTGNNLSLIIKHNTETPRPLHSLVPTVPRLLEKIVLRALAKTPQSRPANAAEFRHELLAASEKLGLENARANLQATLELLKDQSVESPSGRFVIDLEKLREHRAAQNKNQTSLRPAESDDETTLDAVPPDQLLMPYQARALPTQKLAQRSTIQLEKSPVMVVPPSLEANSSTVTVVPQSSTPQAKTQRHKSHKGLVCGLAVAMLAAVGLGTVTLLNPPAGSNYEGMRQSVGAPTPAARPQVRGVETPQLNAPDEATPVHRPGAALQGTANESLEMPSSVARPAPTPAASLTVPVKSPETSPTPTPNTNAVNALPFAGENLNKRREAIGRAHLETPTPSPAPPPAHTAETVPSVAPFPAPVTPETSNDAEQRGAARPRTVTRPH